MAASADQEHSMLHRKPRILVVGSFVMDVIATTEQIPGAGQTVYGKSFHMAPGGKGANQALQCARLGAEVTMVGCVGDDLFGQQLLEPLREAGMDVSHVVVRKGIHSGVGHVVLEVTEHSAQNRIVVIPGANRTLTVEEVAWIQQAVSGFDMVLLQLEVPIEVNRAVARWAREAGVPVILNPAPATELDDELLSLVSYLIPNEQEASQETHLPLRFDKSGPWDEDLRNIADTLQGKGVEHVIITLGSYGSAVAETGGPRYVPCVHMEHVADPTAAGDSFVGALSTALAVGLPEDAALTFASHTAAITVSRLGAMPSLPTLPEVLEQSVLIGSEYPVMDTLLFYVENGETPEMSLLTRSRRHSSLTLCSVSRAMYCFVMPQSRPIRSRLLISTTSTFPARTASITSCKAGRSRVIPEPCSAAAPTMVYPACFA